mgnify:CR=1 FL=1|jgi:5'-deoxynucleotidase YfbR-like HD superfamily hydrolase
MKIKNLSLVVLIMALTMQIAIAQEKSKNEVTPDEIQKVTLKLIEYYESYEDGSTESQRRAKHDNAIDAMSRGAANSQDKNDAYKIIDAYIKADKDPGANHAGEQQGSPDDAIKQTEEYKKAEKAINNGMTNLMNMSYPEFEKTVLQLQPNSSRREIKETYNKMHKNDGKQVAITAADDELTPQQQMLWAVKAIENPKNYEEFVKAAKILDPKVSDEKLKKGWEKYKVK